MVAAEQQYQVVSDNVTLECGYISTSPAYDILHLMEEVVIVSNDLFSRSQSLYYGVSNISGNSGHNHTDISL